MRQPLLRLSQQLGVPGIVAVGLLCSSLVFYVLTLRPMLETLHARHAAAERMKIRPPQAHQVALESHGEDLRRFRSLFPAVDEVNEELERVHRLARRAGLRLEQGEYRFESREAGLALYRVTLPVRGNYSGLRGFVSLLLSEMPAASLDALGFQRKKPGDREIESRIRLTLYFRPADQGL
jgi:hypothetical protein